MKQSLLTLGAAFALAGVSQAAGTWVIDNFDSYSPNQTMAGKTSTGGINTWSVGNNISVPVDIDPGPGVNIQQPPIAITTDYTFDLSAGAALIGGYTPTNGGQMTTLSSAANIAMFNTSTPIIGNPARFTIDFGFLDSTTANRDHYTIELDSTGGNLVTITLTPSANVNTYNISFSSDFFTGVNNWGTIDSLDSFGNPYFSLEFATGTDGIGGMFYSLKDLGNNTVMSDGTLADGLLLDTALGDHITNVKISMDGNATRGDGFLVIDNVSLIPEPSSSLLGLLGLTLAVTRRRRA